jgi:hypothetical protein
LVLSSILVNHLLGPIQRSSVLLITISEMARSWHFLPLSQNTPLIILDTR